MSKKPSEKKWYEKLEFRDKLMIIGGLSTAALHLLLSLLANRENMLIAVTEIKSDMKALNKRVEVLEAYRKPYKETALNCDFKDAVLPEENKKHLYATR